MVALGTLANGRGVVVTGHYDGAVQCWDLNTGSSQSDRMQVHDAHVREIATVPLPDGSTLAISGGQDGSDGAAYTRNHIRQRMASTADRLE